MTSITRDWNHQFNISPVFCKNLLESITQVEEIFSCWNFTLKNFWLNIKFYKGWSHSFLSLCLCFKTVRSAMFVGVKTWFHIGWFLRIFTVSSEVFQWIVELGDSISLIFNIHCSSKHVNFFVIKCIINKSRIIFIILSWLHERFISKSSEILWFVLRTILWKKTFFGLNVVTNRMLLANCLCSAVSVWPTIKILTLKTFNMASVPWYLLISNLMIGTTNPIFRVTTHVTIHNFILINGWYEIRAIESTCFISLLHSL